MNSIDIVIIDKTGTVTEGKPSVEKVISITPGISDEDVLQKIISLNSSSEHPLAQATIRYGANKNIEVLPVTDFEAITGKGVTGILEGKKVALGNEKLMEEIKAVISADLKKQVNSEQKLGKTVSFLSESNTAIGFVVTV